MATLIKKNNTNKGRYSNIMGEFIANNGEVVAEDYLKYISSIVQVRFYYSAKIIETDYYNKVSLGRANESRNNKLIKVD